MKTRIKSCLVAIGCLSILHFQLSTCVGQGTAFSYQGRLNENGTPFSGNAEFHVTLWDALSGGNPVATNNPAQLIVPVNNGLFTLPLDFGMPPFAAGASRWAQLEVRTSIGSFSLLTPRQELTPTPYAIYAQGASASGLTGALPPSALSGIYTNPLTLNNGGNSLRGTFIGDGSALANVNAAAVGGVGVSNLWHTTGNTGTSAANFLGTTDNQPLEFRAGNVRGLRIEPDPRGIDVANLIGGHPSNRIEQPDSGGSVIAGGGAPLNQNIIRSNSSGAFIGAGSINVLGPNASDSVITGGKANSAASYAVAVGGGLGNVLQTNADYSVISGGNANLIQTNSSSSTIGGGAQNEIHGAAPFSTIAGGWFNKIRVTSDQSAIGGGNANQIYPGARESFIGGGFANLVHSNAANGVIGGGAQNIISNAGAATISGGVGNTNTGYAATVAGGFYNTAANSGAAVGGGGLNIAAGFNATVAGGDSNQSLAPNAATGGGFHNTNSGNAATIAGGYENQAATAYATVPGGFQNHAGGLYSFAAGRQAKAIHSGAFVWADSTSSDFPSATLNEFAVRANGGVRFETAGAPMTLNSQPVVTASSTNTLTLVNPANAFNGSFSGTFSGNGSGLTSLNASQLTSGTVPDAQLAANVSRLGQSIESEELTDGTIDAADVNAGSFNTTFWRVGGNAGTTTSTHFLGTTDNQPLDFKVNNLRGFRIEDNGDGNDSGITPDGAPNVIGGAPVNYVAAGVVGATISGGGATNFEGFSFTNAVSSDFAAVGGGLGNRVENASLLATIAGGYLNDIGTNSAFSAIGGGSDNNITNDSAYATIGGGLANDIGGSSDYSTIGGGNDNDIAGNSASSTIAGGISNDIGINSFFSAIGGGSDNNIGGGSLAVTVAGGVSNDIGANSQYASVGGGYDNTIAANSSFATIPGGTSNLATNYAFAAGRRAKANHTGAFVWADSQNADFASTTNNQFRVRAGGGAEVVGGTNTVEAFKYSGTRSGGFGSPVAYGENNNTTGNSAPAMRLVAKGGDAIDGVLSVSTLGTGLLATFGNASVFVSSLTTNGTWSALAFNPTSDRASKENFSSVDPRDVLDKVAALPLARWNYKAVPGAEHIGPVAQDFHAAFGLNGEDDKHIATVDADGVALAAIQGLNLKLTEELRRRDAENLDLKQRIAKLERLLNHKHTEDAER